MFAHPPHRITRTALNSFTREIAAAAFGLFLIVAASGAEAQTVNVTLGWNPSAASDIAGYYIYQGGASLSYTDQIDVGNVTDATVSGLTAGITYYFAVSAYDAAGLESTLSSEISYTPSVSTTTSSPAIAVTAPSSGATYTAPATIALAATVTPKGHTISMVRFYSGATLLGESAAAPYAFTWTNVPAGSYGIAAAAVYDTNSTVSSSAIDVYVTTAVSTSPTPVSLPVPWQAADIGSVGTPGVTTVSNGVYTLSGAGSISSTSDSFHFVYQPLSGDGQITAQLSSVDNSGTNGCVGVMIRESLTAGSRYALMSLSTSDAFLWQRRTKTNFKTWSTTAGSGAPPQTWVRITRSGFFFTGYMSADGTNWTQVSSANISMASSIYLGLVVASGDPNVLNTSSFSDMNVVP